MTTPEQTVTVQQLRPGDWIADPYVPDTKLRVLRVDTDAGGFLLHVVQPGTGGVLTPHSFRMAAGESVRILDAGPRPNLADMIHEPGPWIIVTAFHATGDTAYWGRPRFSTSGLDAALVRDQGCRVSIR
ncbi:MAG: hypothetical protein INR66_26125 [Gordonia polyisoprenivorans]|nr:hypothetical protein [Gordonia polyisoprenivorans]